MVLRHGVGGGLSGVWPLPVKPCDSCKAAPALLFCRSDSAFLCIACDGKVHGANRLVSRHERVWMCEVCEQAPATVTCKADAAALCVACDADIHSANTLARRHDRVPVVPFFEPAASVLAKSNAASLFHKNDDDDEKLANRGNNDNDIVVVPAPVEEEEDGMVGRDIEEAWLLPSLTTTKVLEQPDQLKSGDFFFTEVDPFLDLDYGSPMAPRFGANINSSAMDSVVPLQTTQPPAPPFPSLFPPSSGHAFFDAAGDYYQPKPCYSYNTTTPSLSHSVSSSSLDVGVVPDGSDTGGGGGSKAAAGAVDAGGGGTGVDREARVLRYREKRKNRKFEKTIRYASRKAYAETRPRIRGRFAKRAVVEGDANGIYSSAAAAMIADAAGYGVVPSF